MKHRVGYNPLGRKPSHRKALHRNMVTSLFKHERIRTTKAKAQAIRRTAEKMITRAKVDSVHNRRIVGKDLKDKAILAKLFVELGPRFKERPGGYTRMLKIGPRPGDAAEMVLLELVGEMQAESTPKAKRGDSAKKTSDAKKAAKPKAAEAKAEAPESSESGDATTAQTVEEPEVVESETAESQTEQESASDGAEAEESAETSDSDEKKADK